MNSQARKKHSEVVQDLLGRVDRVVDVSLLIPGFGGVDSLLMMTQLPMVTIGEMIRLSIIVMVISSR